MNRKSIPLLLLLILPTAWEGGTFEHRLTRHLISLNLRIRELETLFSNSYGYPGSIHDITGHIFWQMIFRSITDPELSARMRSWVEDFSKPQRCALCAESFTPILIPPEYYFGSNGNASICYACIDPEIEIPPASGLNPLIVKFVEACGFPPPDGVTPIDWRVNIKIPHERQLKVIEAWTSMGGIHHVKNALNASWFEAMYDAGSLPDGTVSSGRGVNCMHGQRRPCMQFTR